VENGKTEPKTCKPQEDKTLGIDLGIKDLAVCSDGKIYPNIKNTKKYSKQLSYEQRQLSKKQKGSNSRNRQRIKVAKVHEKIGRSEEK
jgi:putative transposase